MALEHEGGVDFDYRKRVVYFETLCYGIQVVWSPFVCLKKGNAFAIRKRNHFFDNIYKKETNMDGSKWNGQPFTAWVSCLKIWEWVFMPQMVFFACPKAPIKTKGKKRESFLWCQIGGRSTQTFKSPKIEKIGHFIFNLGDLDPGTPKNKLVDGN